MKRVWWRRRWVRACVIAGVVIILLIVIGPQLARPIVRAQLQAAIAEDIDAQVEIGWISWSPLYNVTVHNVRLRANHPSGGQFDLINLDRIRISLARAPWRSGPILVDDFTIASAAMRIVQGKDGIVGIKTHPPKPLSKISDSIRLHHFAIPEIRVDVEDQKPISLAGMSIALAPADPSVSQYQCIFESSFARLDANFDVDRLLLTADLSRVKYSPDDAVKCESGSLVVNFATSAWGISDLKLLLAAPKDASQLSPTIADLLKRANSAGTVRCTFNGSGPITMNKETIDQVEADLQISPGDLSIRSADLPLPLTDFADINIHVHDGIAVAQGIRAGYGDDIFFLEKASVLLRSIFDNQLSIDHLDGCVTLAKNAPSYPAPLDQYTAIAQPRGPFWFHGSAKLDLVTSKPDFNIRVITDRAAITTNQFHIPLTNVNLDVQLTPAAVDLNRFDADVLSGKLSTTGHLTLGEVPTYSAFVKLRLIDLNTLAQTAVAPGEKPITVSGDLNCDLNMKGRGMDISALDNLVADGALQIEQGEMFRIPGFKEVADIVGLSNLATIGDAAVTFHTTGTKIHVNSVAVGAPAIGVKGEGDIELISGKLNLDLVATPFNDWEKNIRQKDNPIANVAGSIAGQVQKGVNHLSQDLYRIHVGGTINDPKVVPIVGLKE